MKLENASFTIFDFETTGLYPYAGDKICEVGAIRFRSGIKKVEKFYYLIDPERPISAGAFYVNGITDDMVKGKPTIGQIMPAFLKFIKGSVLVAYNAGFDLGFFESALGRNESVLADYYIIDALRLARRLFPGLEKYNLGYVSESLGIDSCGEHRAMKDAFMTWKVFEKELKLLAGHGVKSIEEIAQAQAKRPLSIKTVKDYKVKLIEDAIREQKKLHITYRSAWSNKVTSRTITPKEIQAGYDRSYVVAHCHLKGAERNFRLDCIVEAKVVK